MPVDDQRSLTHACLNSLGHAQRQIIEALGRSGELSVNELSGRLSVSPSAIRQHMARLLDEDLVTFREVTHGRRGRPTRLFSLTPAGNRMLPTVSDELALTLFYQIMEARPEVVLPVLQDRFRRVASVARATMSGEEHGIEAVRSLASIMESADFLPTVEEGDVEGEFTLTLGHCPLLSLAHAFDAVCATEAESIEMFLPGARIERDRHRLAGDLVCRFRIRMPLEEPARYARAG